MLEGYSSENFDSIDEALDELLCEYVDGTMDSTVREAFEEYLDANPDLAYHVECLCRTRQKLCDYGCRHTRESLHLEIRRRVALELKKKEQSVERMSSRLGNAARITSVVSLVLILGMMVGVTAVSQMKVDGSDVTVVGVDNEAPLEIVTDAHSSVNRAIPLEWPIGRQPVQSPLAPVSVLPAISTSGQMTPITWLATTSDSLQQGRYTGAITP